MEHLTSFKKKRVVPVIISGILSFIFFLNLFSLYSYADNKFCEAKCLSDIDIYRNHDNDCMKIALTFDDGPHPKYTPQILNILDKYRIKATFFTVGINAYYYPDTLREVSKRGHEIGNHTFSHPHVNQVDSYHLKEEIAQCEETVYGITDLRTRVFRPPEGMIDSSILAVVRELDYRVILWDIDTRDWAHTPAEDIAKNVIEHIKPGSIILMHDYIGSNSPTCEAMNIFIPKLIKMGYKFVVISELIDTK